MYRKRPRPQAVVLLKHCPAPDLHCLFYNPFLVKQASLLRHRRSIPIILLSALIINVSAQRLKESE